MGVVVNAWQSSLDEKGIIFVHVERKKIYLINYLNAGPHFSLMQIQAGPTESGKVVPKIFRFFKHALHFQTELIDCMDYAIKILKQKNKINWSDVLVATLIIPCKVVPESKSERVIFFFC